MEKNYVVVTIFTPPTAPKRGPIVNTYGPFDRSHAQYERKLMLRQASREGYSQHLTVKTSKLIDITALNAALDANAND